MLTGQLLVDCANSAPSKLEVACGSTLFVSKNLRENHVALDEKKQARMGWNDEVDGKY